MDLGSLTSWPGVYRRGDDYLDADEGARLPRGLIRRGDGLIEADLDADLPSNWVRRGDGMVQIPRGGRF